MNSGPETECWCIIFSAFSHHTNWTLVYYAGTFSAFSHRTNWTLVYYAGTFSAFSHPTNWTLVYYAGTFSAFSLRTNWKLVYYAGIFSALTHHTNWALVYYAGKQWCLAFVGNLIPRLWKTGWGLGTRLICSSRNWIVSIAFLRFKVRKFCQGCGL